MRKHTAYIALGGNLGDRYSNIARAVEKVRVLPDTRVEEQSSNYLTAPVGPQDQPHFVNAAIKITTDLSPRELLDALKEIEKFLGRTDTGKWGPRTIDLDILIFDEVVIDEAGLKIPHPEMHNREFVLEPLCEIAPDAMHPKIRRTARQMLHDLRNPKN